MDLDFQSRRLFSVKYYLRKKDYQSEIMGSQETWWTIVRGTNKVSESSDQKDR